MGIWDDDFTGTNGDPPNSTIWEVISNQDNSFRIDNNEYEFEKNSYNATPETITYLTKGRFFFAGDFDIQVDLTNRNAGSSGGTWIYAGLGIEKTDGSVWELVACRCYNGTNYREGIFDSNASGTPEYARNTSSYTVPYPSKFRITRSGSTVTAYVWDGSQWEYNNSTSGYSLAQIGLEDVRPIFRVVIGRNTYSQTFTFAFDNFLVNSGTAEALPYYGEVEDEIGFQSAINAQSETAYTEDGIGFESGIDCDTDWGTVTRKCGFNAAIEASGNVFNNNNATRNQIGVWAEIEAFSVQVYQANGFGVNAAADAKFQTAWTQDEIGLNADVNGEREFSYDADAEIGINAAADAYNYSDFIRQYGFIGRKVFIFTLTGLEDGVEDVEIKAFSVNARKRSDATTYLSVVISRDNIDDVLARQNGELVIDAAYVSGGEIVLREELIRTAFDSIDDNQGARSGSIILSGYRQANYGSKDVALTKPVYRRLYDGKLQFRFAEIDFFLNPGDVLTVGAETITVGNISYYLTPSRQQVDVFEIA